MGIFNRKDADDPFDHKAVEEENAKRLRENNDKIELRAIAYKRLFLKPDGELNEDAKVVFDDWKEFAKLFKLSYDPGNTDAMMINEGRREFFLRILANLEYDAFDLAKFKPAPKPTEEIPNGPEPK